MEEEKNKVVVRITEDGIIIGDFPSGDYVNLVKLIGCNDCILQFDCDVNFRTFMKKLDPYINEIYCYGLADYIKDFIAEQYTQQVLNNSI